MPQRIAPGRPTASPDGRRPWYRSRRMQQIFRTKSLDRLVSEAELPSHQLKRTLGAFDVTMLGIGAIVGAGIFATIGTATAGDPARPGAGPALILSFVLTGVAWGVAALCYAEFAAVVPISGSAPTYSYAPLGVLVAGSTGRTSTYGLRDVQA